ncbi:MAG: flagellar export chaperone FliS [Steroidobacteraceae bacterium]
MKRSGGGLAAYQTVATHGGVAAADPHKLILMLMDGALERMASGRSAIEVGSTAERNRLLHRAISIVDELRGTLNLEKGGEMAANMSDLYTYICKQLLKASIENRLDVLDEASALLQQLRGAWVGVPAEARSAHAAGAR